MAKKRNRQSQPGAVRLPDVSLASPHVSIEVCFVAAYLAVLALFAGARIFVGAAAMPFFTNVDEESHYDTVAKYARGYWPGNHMETLDRDTASLIALYQSRGEFVLPPTSFPGGTYPPPVWSLPDSAAKDSIVRQVADEIAKRPNHEAHSPPAYYALAAVWLNVGALIGIKGAQTVYWVRFLAIPLYVALIAAAYGFCRAYFSPWVAIATPLLVAVYPASTFFGITNDVLSPLAMLVAIWLLLRWHSEAPSMVRSFATGFTVAVTVLVKLTNVAILIACASVIVSRLVRSRPERRWADINHALAMTSAAILPIAAWMLRNRLALGDWTGSGSKLSILGWQVKPWERLLDHPLFSFTGLKEFFGGLTKSFYCGDVSWHGAVAMDATASTVLYFFVTAVAMIGLIGIWIAHYRRGEDREYQAGALSGLAIVGSILLLAWLSLRFDFGNCRYPSRESPYLISGRLISGVLVPVLALYLRGLAVIARRSKLAIAVLVGASVLLMTLPQVAFFARALKSPYNWFHIP